jgi:hypothetical protein
VNYVTTDSEASYCMNIPPIHIHPPYEDHESKYSIKTKHNRTAEARI